ncbi:ADP-ribose pyrophosphatase YjhB, NUDIX family [Paenibacillus algorifonticola]|uniref:ADP-ribose pyrophosphatase YjhB, NUDIX family n=1 Tax=Paenibacillus algorifonticola TaxID=684063 RepID=A0A1I1ZU01_9BACL|nr:NUDIX domain-containing protein [Paenibacillus algorifonticola]SFE35087.1 ADP-ribose pyrophosphatase YjhB, NUDIX family [Paenibacillus algorifonticola]
MTMISCACLVKQDNNKLLLVRVRDNELWYLPGGKIEPGEDPQEALVRELKEELNIDIQRESIQHLRTVIGPAYKENASVELICYTATWAGDIVPCSEISEVDWVDSSHYSLLAPAVIKLVEQLEFE